MKSINPYTGDTVFEAETHGQAAIEAALTRAVNAVQKLKAMGMDARLDALRRAADILDDQRDAIAELMTREMGKPIKQARAEVEKCAWVCRYYADEAPDMLKPDPIKAPEKGDCSLHHLPIGPVFAVMPWNFPFWQVFRFAAPNLAVGNPGLLKHASAVPGSALKIAEVLDKAGFPEGAFQTLLIGSDKTETIITDDRIRGVTLTGSEGAGSAVASLAGKAIKPSVMELGGSDAFIVMPSADLDKAVETAVTARTQNNGQSCIAAKRFIIHQDVYEEFTAKFVQSMKALKIGDPMDDSTDIGPLSSADAADEVFDLVRQTIDGGAKVLLASERKDHAFLTPGVLADIPRGTPGHDSEIFAPVALMFKAEDVDHAIAIANTHPYGLGSSFWSKDKSEIETACTDLEAGSTYVNQMVASDPRLPFGGVKKSGYGRELARDGLLAFTNPKTIAITGLD
ncbi:NAD-dependent succinate-semialdehyde dehydrogenase [Oceanicaulis sp.]|uniref:NAD-dependent succinate-semialdehyde dehydrogenase n=1 Tax=Oceanicaulis sp. TaxID=1924941 RepID=UPI003F72A282